MMKKTCLSTVMVAALAMALTGCGASKLSSLAGSSNEAGAIASKLVWKDSKTTAKSVAAAPAGVTSIQVTVTGSDDTGKAIPVVRQTSTDVASNTATVTGIYPGRVSLAVKAFTGTTVSYEGFVTGVPVTSGGTNTLASAIVMTPPMEKVVDQGCVACHENTLAGGSGQNIVAEFKLSGHYTNGSVFLGYSTPLVGVKVAGCAGCHGKNHNVPDPSGSGRCAQCHTTIAGTNHTTTYVASQPTTICSSCHNPHNPLGPFAGGDCVKCHAFQQDFTGRGNYVNDNSGVRAVMTEFAKRSHHIITGTPKAEQCAVCHLEGVSDGNGGVTIDVRYHMADNKIHLRNADTDADFVWGGTEHTNMDNFCFSCHDNNGATSAGIAAIMTGKNYGGAFSASNPFADTLTNSYDQVARAGVVDVKTAFTATNASHHAVSGQRYKYRFSNAANAAAWAAAHPSEPAPTAAEIAVGNTDLDGNAIPASAFDSTNQAAIGLNDKTLYEAEKFVATYIPLGATKNVADNSLLHCGDCHTVGQWKSGSSTSADGSATTAVIGAHGSANDYLLRNSLGTDALHSSQTYVCFNCHIGSDVVVANDALWAELVADGEISSTVVKPTWNAGWNRLHPNVIAGQLEGGYTTAHAVSAFHAQCQADSSAMVGTNYPAAAGTVTPSRITYSTGGGHKDRTLDFVPAANATATIPGANAYSWVGQTSTSAAGGNITGIACTNCHNSGLRTGWGGIHGGNSTYTDGLGRTQKTYRFMPGMGNYRYAPPGGWNGKDKTDASLVTQTGAGVGAGKPMGGCYTNGTSTAGDINPAGFSACNHHGTSTSQTTAGGQAAGFRTTYGGGTTSTPTASEPTVREATAGGTLVTRPLKY
jgi:hypothetical protein